ncbi:MAG: hypothetical protein OSB36_10645, partial [Longimicrobiales bacterium]|nr:hypothetical protein [Longimicrobiales bacterium]
LLVRRPSNACLAAPALHHLTAPLTAPLGQMGSLGRWVGTPCCTRQRSSAATAAALSSWPHFKLSKHRSDPLCGTISVLDGFDGAAGFF